MASNVALFAPLKEDDYKTINGILSATRNKFKKIGLIFLLIGVASAIVYGFLVNSYLSVSFVTTVIIMAVVPAAFNLFYASTYRVLLQSQQKEYVINIITIITLAFGHVFNIVLVLNNGPMWMVRAITMMFALLNSFFIVAYVKGKTENLDINVEPKQNLISGTKDVMVQKITGVIYNSAPIIFLSMFPSGGTILASVYAVYNNVFIMLKSLIHGIIDAPRQSLGQLLKEQTREKVWSVFAQYEYVAFLAIYVMLSTCCVLLLPFIRLYTEGITDANYYDIRIAIIMILITVAEMMHIPCGHLINMAGEFKISKYFQVIACVVLTISMIVGGCFLGVYGMLGSILLVAILLAIMEMGYVHIFFFKRKLRHLFKMLIPLIIVGVLTSMIEFPISTCVDSYTMFIIFGALLVIVNSVIALIVGMIFSRNEMMALVMRIRNLLFSK